MRQHERERARQQKPRRVSLPDESKHHRNTCPISYPLPVRMTRQHFRAGRATPHASAAPSVKRAFQSCAPIRALSLSLFLSVPFSGSLPGRRVVIMRLSCVRAGERRCPGPDV